MKLATLKSDTRDGDLLVVSRDLRHAVRAGSIALTLVGALERWPQVEPALRRLYDEVNAGRAAQAFALDPTRLAAPLPRAPQWLDGSAFHSHEHVLRNARYERNAQVEAQFASYPPLECPSSLAAGFQHDGTFEALVRQALA